MLTPDIQETLLFLARLSAGKPTISEKSLRKITIFDDWEEMRKIWETMSKFIHAQKQLINNS